MQQFSDSVSAAERCHCRTVDTAAAILTSSPDGYVGLSFAQFAGVRFRMGPGLAPPGRIAELSKAVIRCDYILHRNMDLFAKCSTNVETRRHEGRHSTPRRLQ
jgi:hypothetical protein